MGLETHATSLTQETVAYAGLSGRHPRGAPPAAPERPEGGQLVPWLTHPPGWFP
jgi:hypothetical protein